MSRVFDALKQARSSVPSESGVAGIWTALGVGANTSNGQSDDQQPTAVATVEAPPSEPADVHPSVPVVVPETRVLLDPKARLIPHTTNPTIVEHYRMLRTKILQEQEKEPFRSLLVTSASPQEGKSVTVLNLALSFAALPGFRVLLIDGDIRKGSVGQWMGLDPTHPGLSNLMDGSSSLDEVLRRSSEFGLCVIARGNSEVTDVPTSRIKPLFEKLKEQFDLILVDSPPVNWLTDAQLLAESCDAVLLIARAFKTTQKSLEEAVQNLRPFRLIGTVLNGGTLKKKYDYYAYSQ